MKFKLAFICVVAALFVVLAHAATSPTRIVSIAPSFTEILYALGAGPQIVGTTNYCDYPPQAAKTVKIGDVLNPNLEKIISLKPDIVVCGDWKWRLPEKLRAVGISVVAIEDAQNIEDIYERIDIIGRTVSKEEQASEMISELKTKLEAIRKRSQKRGSRRSVYVELDAGNWTAGGASYINEVLQLIALKNIFGERDEPYFMVTLESIAARNPDIILSLNKQKEQYYRAPEWQSITAVRERRVIDKDDFDWNAITRQGPRLAEGIEALEKLVQ